MGKSLQSCDIKKTKTFWCYCIVKNKYYDNFNKELANIVWDVLLCSNDRDKLGQI